jgi:iron complex outermembrane receptor protein
VGKIDAPVLETPQSISIISGERIEATMSQTVMDVLQYTAGVRANMYLDIRRDDFAIRGFQESGRSGVFRDGLRLPALTLYGFWEMDPYGLDRVEVMRGPASVLYGQSSPGGVVNLVTKRPTEKATNEVGLVLGSHDRVQGTLDFSGPMNDSGSLLYRFTALGRDAETQVDHTQDRRIYAAPALTWKPSERASLTVLSNFQKSWNTASPQFLPFEGTVLPNPNGDIPFDRYAGEPGFDRFDKTQSSVGYLLEYQLGDSTAFLQNGRYGRLELDYDVVFSDGLHPDDMATTDRFSLTDAESMNAFSIDNQIQTRWASGSFDHQILLGADYQHATGSVARGFGPVGTFNFYAPAYGTPIARPAFSQITDRESRQVGVYLQDHLKIGERFVVHAALRHDRAKSEIVNVLTGLDLTDLDDEATTYQIGLAYVLPSGIAPYASYSTSFSPISGIDVNGEPFVPEKGKQVEAGFKLDLRALRTFATLAVFDLRKKNVPTAATRDDPFGPEIQTGEVRSKGVELEFNASPLPGLNLLGSYTKNDNEVTESNLVGMPGEVGSIPDYHASTLAALWANYTWQGGGLPGLDVGLGVRYVGSVEVDYPVRGPAFTVPSYELIDAAVSYEWRGYRLALNLSNLANEEYVGACDSYSCYYGIGRTLFGSVKYKW